MFLKVLVFLYFRYNLFEALQFLLQQLEDSQKFSEFNKLLQRIPVRNKLAASKNK